MRLMKSALLALLVSVVGVCVAAPGDNDQMRTVRSQYGFNKTYAMVMKGLRQHPRVQIKLVLNPTAVGRSVGIRLHKVKAIYFGVPRYCATLIRANPRATLFIPINITVWEKNPGHVYVSFWNPETNVTAIIPRHDVAAMKQIRYMTQLLHSVIDPVRR